MEGEGGDFIFGPIFIFGSYQNLHDLRSARI